MVYNFQFRSKNPIPKFSHLQSALISLAGLIGQKVINQERQELGTVLDVVCRWDDKNVYPPICGLVIKVARRKVWLPASSIKKINPTHVILNDAKLDLRDFILRQAEVELAKDVLDHQLIDVTGARVVRASDLYLAHFQKNYRLVAVDVSLKTILRRLGPKKVRSKAMPKTVIDWSSIQNFGAQKSNNKQLKLTSKKHELRLLRPGELADLLEDLGRNERQELLNALTPALAADALEEMEPKEVKTILREAAPNQAANYLAEMEPDEAAEVLREVDNQKARQFIKLMPPDKAKSVRRVLNYDETTAGGIMNSVLFKAEAQQTVAEIKEKLKGNKDINSLQAIAIIDNEGKLLHDLPLVQLLLADDNQKLIELIQPPSTVTVAAEASLKDVIDKLIDNRGISILVTDNLERPLGRILADDLLDAVVPDGRFHFPRLLS